MCINDTDHQSAVQVSPIVTSSLAAMAVLVVISLVLLAAVEVGTVHRLDVFAQ